MICFPLDNTPYEAKDMGTYLATRTRGVFSAESNLTVTPGENGLSVSVSPGLAWLKWSDYWGTAALQEQALTLALDTADGALKRIDAIVCRLDKVNNRAEIVVKKGAPSSAPIVVPPVRDANYDELYIATVLIGAGVISISASAITDQRLNEEYCGLMRDGVTGIPTASLHAQAQQILTELTDALNAQIVRQSAEFDAWFDDLKGKLGEDPATALQLQVDNLNAAVVGDAFQASGSPVSIAYAGTNRIASITAYGENAQDGTTEAPVALTGVDSVFAGGNNLLPKAVRTETTCGITFTPNPDGSILVSGTATTNVGYSYARFERALLGRTVCLSGGSTQARVLINERLSSGAFVRNVLVDRGQGVSGTLTKQKEDNILYATIQVLAGTTVNTTIYPMLNLGESPLPYEPYQGSVTQLPIPRSLRRVGDVKDKCVTRQDYESAEKLVVTYNVGFVELDGTEASHIFEGMFYLDYSASWPTPANRVNGVCSHYPYGAYGKGKIGLTDNGNSVVYNPNGDYTGDEGGLANWKAYLAAQKEAGTPVQVAYQLAAPEVYATDPLDIYVTTMFPVVVSTGPITYEVIPQIHPFKTDWKIQPKTPEGYYNGDWFEIEDYNHILDNYQTIYKIAKALYPDLQIPTFVSPTLGAPTKASEINTIERTIDAFKTLTIALSDVGATKTWLDNGNLFNFEDINRWEQVALSYYTVFLGQVELLPKLQFKLGGAQF